MKAGSKGEEVWQKLDYTSQSNARNAESNTGSRAQISNSAHSYAVFIRGKGEHTTRQRVRIRLSLALSLVLFAVAAFVGRSSLPAQGGIGFVLEGVRVRGTAPERCGQRVRSLLRGLFAYCVGILSMRLPCFVAAEVGSIALITVAQRRSL